MEFKIGKHVRIICDLEIGDKAARPPTSKSLLRPHQHRTNY